MRILVAGYGPFGEVRENPSGRLAEALAAEPGVHAEVLPVSYSGAEQRLEELLDTLHPAAVLLFGVQAEPGFRLERVALNLDHESTPDVEGAVRRERAIREQGPVAYWSTLPLREMGAALSLLGIDWEWSQHAGGFLCNHGFYVARDCCTRLGRPIPCGLVHVPPLSALPLASQVIAARACLDTLRAALGRPSLSAGRGEPSG